MVIIRIIVIMIMVILIVQMKIILIRTNMQRLSPLTPSESLPLSHLLTTISTPT